MSFHSSPSITLTDIFVALKGLNVKSLFKTFISYSNFFPGELIRFLGSWILSFEIAVHGRFYSSSFQGDQMVGVKCLYFIK